MLRFSLFIFFMMHLAYNIYFADHDHHRSPLNNFFAFIIPNNIEMNEYHRSPLTTHKESVKDS